MKIVHLFKHAAPDVFGGIESVIDNLATEHSKLGHDVHVVATAKYRESGTFRYKGYTVTLTKLNISIASTPFSFSYYRHLKSILQQADIIHVHYPYPWLDVCLLALRPDVPIIATYHSDIVRQRLLKLVYLPIQTLFFKQLSKIIVTSPNYLKTSLVLRKYLDKTEVIPLGANDEIPNMPKEASSLPSRDYFLFVGEFRYYKGLHTLIDAATTVEANIVIVGAGPLEQELRKKTKSLGLQNVIFAGRVTDQEKHKLYDQALGVVFPSQLRSEAFGVTLIEGAMHSLPLISCEIGTGTTYVNIHGETGIVCPPNAPKALSEAMMHIRNNPDLAKRFGRNARARYEQKFTSGHVASLYSHLYESLTIR